MGIKVYTSRLSGNMEMKKKQEFILGLLATLKIEYEEIDITDEARQEDKLFMRKHSVPAAGQTVPLPPQIFNGEEYCGDYEGLHEANECDEVHEFLKIAAKKEVSQATITMSEKGEGEEDVPENESTEVQEPEN